MSLEQMMSLSNDFDEKLWRFDNVSFDDYQNFVKTTINKTLNNELFLTHVYRLKKIIKKVIRRKLYHSQKLENFHHKTLLSFLNKISNKVEKSEHLTCFYTQVSDIIVDTLSSELSVKKLNEYNQESKKSILKSVLTHWFNSRLLPLLIKKGLVVNDIEGLNPYYYVLEHSSSTNLTAEVLYSLNIPLPENFWPFVVKKVIEKKTLDRNFLLHLPSAQFIVNEETNECVWNIIIKTKWYDLIQVIPKNFYRPHSINGKGIGQYIIENNDYMILEHLKLDEMLKLLDQPEEILNILLVFVQDEKNRKLFIHDFLPKLIENFIKTKHKDVQSIQQHVSLASNAYDNASNYATLNKLNIVAMSIASWLNEIKEIDETEIISQSDNYHKLDNLIKFYKYRKDAPQEIKENILKYFNTLIVEDINTAKLGLDSYDDTLRTTHNKNIEKMNAMRAYHNKEYYLDDNTLIQILNNLDESVVMNIYQDIMSYIHSLNIPNISTLSEKLKKIHSQEYITIFSEIEGLDKKQNDITLNESETKENYRNIAIKAGLDETQANETVSVVIEDMKKISQYPNKMIGKVTEQYLLFYLKTLQNKFDIEEVYVEDKNENKDEKNNTSEESNNTTNTNISADKQAISIDLFSEDSVQRFKKEHSDSNNDVLSNFVKKHQSMSKFKKKTLALADTLLSNVDSLYETFPHFEKVIEHIENLMILQNKGDKSFYIPPLLLGGGPGLGKTFFCNTLSKLVQTHFELLNMESMTANFVLTGLSANWHNATPGKIFKSLFNLDYKNMNPIFVLDELEKSGGNNGYSVMNSLLPLLERYTAKNFKDECIPLAIDASYITWIATANDLDKLSAPIKSRFDIFSVPNPTPVQRKALIKGIYKTVRENNTWGHHFSEKLPDESLEVLANLMAPGAARDLRKSITLACSKAIREDKSIILPEHIERYEQGETLPWDIIV